MATTDRPGSRGWYDVFGRRLFFSMDPERSHRVALATLALPLPWARIGHEVADPGLATSVAGVPLANPIGLASGFDKSCERFRALGRLGFGYVVGGTVTRAPRPGNAKPRIARDPATRALVNAMGLPNPGAAAVAATLAHQAKTTSRWVSLADEAVEDVSTALELLAPHVDAFELNASSPNAGWTHRADHVGEVMAAIVPRSPVRAVSGPPESPPRPVDIRGSCTGIVLAQVIPAAPASRAARSIASTPSRSSSAANGGTFTNTGPASAHASRR